MLDDVVERRSRHRHFEFNAFRHTGIAMVITTDEGRSEFSRPVDFGDDPLEMMRAGYQSVGGIPFVGSQLYEREVRALAELPPSFRSGASHQVLTHPRISRFREMEYTVPAETGPECLREIMAASRRSAIPVVFPIVYRYVRSDDVWLSIFHEQEGCSISIHQLADLDYRPYFDAIERKYGGRPHWGKLHCLEAEQLQALYPRWREFLDVREALDPTGRMLNSHLADVFGLTSSKSGQVGS